MVAKRDGGLEDVAYGLHLVAEQLAVGYKHTVQRGRGLQREVPVVGVGKALYRVAHLFLVVLVPMAVLLVQVHIVVERQVRRQVQVVEQRETSLEGELM